MNRGGALVRDVSDSLRSQPGRIALAAMAVGIGAGALSLLLAVLGGLEARARELVAEFGADTVAVVQAERRPRSRAPVLCNEHAAYLRANLPEMTVAGLRRYAVPQPGSEAVLTLAATDEHLAAARQWTLRAGRFLDAADLLRAERHAVITHRVAQAWGWRVGDTFPAGRTLFTIIGIVEAGGDAMDTATGNESLVLGDWVAFIPMTVRPTWLSQQEAPRDLLDVIFIRAPGVGPGRALQQVMHLFSHPDHRAEGVSWVTPAVLLRDIRRLQSTLSLVAGGVTLLSLVLGGVTLAAMLVASVRQRIPEIGLRRALGATRADVGWLFIWEGIVVTFTAGLAGTALAQLLLSLAPRIQSDLPLYAGPGTWLVPVAAAVGLGTLCSFAPARTAARIVPAEAMRVE